VGCAPRRIKSACQKPKTENGIQAMPQEASQTLMQEHYAWIKEVIQQEDMWERVPDHARDFSPENLENLVKYAYFGGFIDSRQVSQLLFLKKGAFRQMLVRWYEEIREKGCWLC
jgi:hypothetical protein